MNNGIENTQNALGVVAGWISENNGVHVVWHNKSDICADLKTKTLYIPRITESEALSGEKIWQVRGHVYHEAGHIACTKQEEWRGKGFHGVFNCMEDRRMERVLSGRYAGCGVAFKYNLRRYNEELGRRFSEDSGISPSYKALCYASMKSEGLVPSWELDCKSAEIYDAIADDFDNWKFCKSSRELESVAWTVWEKIRDIMNEQEERGQGENNPQGGSGEGESGNEKSVGAGKQSGSSESGEKKSGKEESGEESGENGSDGDESGEGSSSGDEDEGKESGNGSSSENGEDGKSESVKVSGNEDGEGSSSGEGDDGNSESVSGNGEKNGDSGEESGKDNGDGENAVQSGGNDGADSEEKFAECAENMSQSAVIGQAVKQIIDEALLEAASDTYTCFRGNDVHETKVADEHTREVYTKMMEKLNSEAAVVARSLEQYLRAVTKTRTLNCQRRGRIDSRRLAHLAKSLSKDVFKGKTTSQSLDTAIEIVIDESGSMQWESAHVRQAVAVLAEALNRIHIPFEVTGGTTRETNTLRIPAGFTRANPVQFMHYKTFSDNWETVRSSVTGISAYRNFVDGEMVEFAAARLAARPEKRKIVFTMSDGCPCSGDDHDELLGKKLRNVCKDCRKKGIEVYSFGISTDEPSKYYGEKFHTKLEPHELGTGIAKGVRSVLMNGRLA